MKLNLLVSIIFIGQLLSAQTFTESPQKPPFEGLSASSIAFSDVDGDNDQDVLITGTNGSVNGISKLYTNDGMGNFTERIGTPFDGVFSSSIAFSDVDGDNDQDVLITGDINGLRTPISKLYINDGMGNFTERLGTPFEGVYRSSIAFSDVDGDNDQDVLITGRKGAGFLTPISKLYINDGMGNFTERLGTPFEGVFFSSIAFSDVDGDNDQDVLITGGNSSVLISKLYTNDGIVSSKDHVSDGLRFEFIIYPNPSGMDKFKISCTSNENGSLTVNVFDLNGRLLIQQLEQMRIGEHTFFIDIALLVKGSYIIQLDDGIRKGVRKFLVN